MRESFNDVISKMQYHFTKQDEGYRMPLIPGVNMAIGNILPGQYTVVAGQPSSGKTSFVDCNYVMGTLLQWYVQENRQPLKIVYFSLKDGTIKKLQMLLCTYLKMVYNYRVDIPTLNSQPGRVTNIAEQPVLLEAIDTAQGFFDYIIDNGVLDIISDVTRPTEIYNIAKAKALEMEEAHSGLDPLLMIVVDPVDRLTSESDGYRGLSGVELDERLNVYASELSKVHYAHVVLVTPTIQTASRFPKENEPTFRQLGLYGTACDRGIIMYNPIGDGNFNYLMAREMSVDNFKKDGLNLLRIAYIAKNTDGIEAADYRLLFMPGTGFMIEHKYNNEVSKVEECVDKIFGTQYNDFYKKFPKMEETEVLDLESDTAEAPFN